MALKKLRMLGVATTVYFALGSMSAFATVVENFTAIVVGDNSYTGNTYLGTFSYDENALSGIGMERLSPAFGELTIDFTFEGQALNETNDIAFWDTSGEAPSISFFDGTPNFINYWIVCCDDGVDFNDPTIRSIEIINHLIPVVGGGFTVDTRVVFTPVPAGIWLFGSGLIGLVGVARRKNFLSIEQSL